MSARILSGKEFAQQIKEDAAKRVEEIQSRYDVTPGLAVILVGDDPASQVYVRNKKKACEYVGIRSLSYELPEETSEEELLKLIDDLNEREDCQGILVQLPLPKHIDSEKVLLRIDPKKDVDGFHPVSVGNLSIGNPGFVSCTPAGIIELLKRSGVELDGANAVIVGRSNIVGKPMAMLLLRENCTVTIAHSHTRNLSEVTSRADILIAAIGKPKFFKAKDVKENAVVIDVGMDRDENGKLCGDVDYEDMLPKVSKITPVPGGVGPMTIAMLMKNCVDAVDLF